MKSIKQNVIKSICALFLLGALLNTLTTFLTLKDELNELFDENMEQLAQALSPESLKHNMVNSSKTQQKYSHFKGEEEFLIQYWQDSKIVYSSKPAVQIPKLTGPGLKSIILNNQEWKVYQKAINNSEIIEIAQMLSTREVLIWEIYQHQLIPVILQMPVLILLVWVLVSHGFKPINHISELITRRHSNFLQHIPIQEVPKEIIVLVTSLNELLSKLELTLEQQKKFTADAAHELRTPLTALRLELDFLNNVDTDIERQESIARLYQVTDRSSRLIHQLLSMARQETLQTETLEKIQLSQFLQELVAEFKAMAHSKNGTLLIHCPEDLELLAIKNSLFILMSNLVSNGLHYSDLNPTIIISAESKIDSNSGQKSIQVSVADDGPGIPPIEQERIFDRFYRVLNHKHKAGSGLGLAIVKSIADQHNATIELSQGIDNKGITFKIIFPQPT